MQKMRDFKRKCNQISVVYKFCVCACNQRVKSEEWKCEHCKVTTLQFNFIKKKATSAMFCSGFHVPRRQSIPGDL